MQDQNNVLKFDTTVRETNSTELTEAVYSSKPTDAQMMAKPAEDESDLTYSQEYYILDREEILQKRREKEMEAKFGDFSARLVKRPKKNFLWGFGTQMHEEGKTKEDFFEPGKLPTIR